MKFNYEYIYINGFKFYSIEVKLPKTTLLVVGNENGYFMCGALDVDVFDSKEHLKARRVLCGNAYGVKTIEELINAPAKKVSLEAKRFGIEEGMLIKDALLIISQ